MNSRERQSENPAAAPRMAQPLNRAPKAGANAPSPVMWQGTGVRVPPVLGSAAGILRVQQLKGNRAVGQMLAVQRDSEAQGWREPSDEEIHSAAAEGIRTPATTLPFLDRIQASFGRHSIGHIKAHVGPEAAKASRAMNARAFASGDHVVFGDTPDLRTAAHEAAHVVQQQAGVQLAGGIGREGDAYERNADAVAEAVVAGRSAKGLLEPFEGSVHAPLRRRLSAVQLMMPKRPPHSDQQKMILQWLEEIFQVLKPVAGKNAAKAVGAKPPLAADKFESIKNKAAAVAHMANSNAGNIAYPGDILAPEALKNPTAVATLELAFDFVQSVHETLGGYLDGIALFNSGLLDTFNKEGFCITSAAASFEEEMKYGGGKKLKKGSTKK